VDSCDPRIKDGIYVMRADGTRRRLIREMPPDKNDIPEYPAISPSGEFLAFDQFLGETYIMRVDRHAEMRYLSDCPKVRCPLLRYTEQVQPAWSPTGHRLALTLSGVDGEGDAGHIGTVDTRGLNLRLVTRGRRDAMPDWSPTGDRIAFQRERFIRGRFEGDVFTAPAHAKRFHTPRRLTATRDSFFPVWSPSRRFIAYVRAPDLENGALWIMRAGDGRGQRLLISGVVPDRIGWQARPRR
jgi:Tol biopolymer transport system component